MRAAAGPPRGRLLLLAAAAAVAATVTASSGGGPLDPLFEFAKCHLCEVGGGEGENRENANATWPSAPRACCPAGGARCGCPGTRAPRRCAAPPGAPRGANPRRLAPGLSLPPPPRAQVQPVSGQIDDCCCDVETVDRANTRHFLPILHELTQT